jgi:hypothetical protein
MYSSVHAVTRYPQGIQGNYDLLLHTFSDWFLLSPETWCGVPVDWNINSSWLCLTMCEKGTFLRLTMLNYTFLNIDQLQLVPPGGDSAPPPRDQHGAKIFLSWHPGPTSWAKIHGASFLGQTTIRTRQSLLGFYPSVQITSQFMSHDWESQLRSEYFSQSYWKFGQNDVAR